MMGNFLWKIAERMSKLQERWREIKLGLYEKDESGDRYWLSKSAKEMEKKGTKGKFREWCIEHGFRSVNKSCIERAKKVARETGNTTLLRRAIWAENAMRASGALK